MSVKTEPCEVTIMVNLPVYYCDGCRCSCKSNAALFYTRPDTGSAFTAFGSNPSRAEPTPKPLPPAMTEIPLPGGKTRHLCEKCLDSVLNGLAPAERHSLPR